MASNDIDGDFDEDLVLLGWDIHNEIYTDLFINDGGGNFVENTIVCHLSQCIMAVLPLLI